MNRLGYIVIQQWMVTDLHLAGNELLVYAVIYGYSQDGESEYYGSLSHLQELLLLSRRTVLRVLQRLLNAGLIAKRSAQVDSVHRCFYRAIDVSEGGGVKMTPGWCQNDTGVVSKRHPNNKNNNKNNNIKEKTLYNIESPKEKAEASASYTPKNIFIKPSVEEVARYCAERGNLVDPQRFYDYNEACGWMIGPNKKMKDWRAAVRTWERRESNNYNNYRNGRCERLKAAREAILADIEDSEHTFASPVATAAILPEDLFTGL